MRAGSPAAPGVVKKVEGGFDKPHAEQELPLDINYQKLVEWLVVRQKLPQDWHKRLQAIQAKVAEAVKELPADVLMQVAGSAEAAVDYFRAVQVRDTLAATSERSLFGGLTGQAGTWDKIVKAYENGGVFVGEAAQTLVQHVDYEIPYLRKQMAKCSQAMADAERRQGDYVRSATACAFNYKKECEKLGITGSGAAVQAELQQLTSQLPGLFERLVSELRSPQLQPAIAYYQAFTQYAHGGSGNGAGKQQEAAALPDVLPVLTEVRSRATPAWTGAADAANNVAPTSAAASGGIDWGISADGGDAAAPGAAAADGGITWDLGDLPAASAGAGASDAAAAGISWDLGAEAAAAAAEAPAEGDAAAAAGGGGGPSLNWDIDLSGVDMEASGQDAAAGAGGINWDVDTPAAADEGGSAAAGGSSSGGGAAARDASAAWLQHDSEYRARLVDDLQELRAFLRSRAAGLSGSSSSQDLLRALAPDVVASTDARDVAAMLGVVEGCLARLADERLRQLLMIASSARYVERLSGSLRRKAGQEAKMLAAAAETQARQQESRARLASLQPKLVDIVGRMRRIKGAVEAAVSKQFAGRHVNVLGEINNALASTA